MIEKDKIEELYIEVNGNKGIFTLREVVSLLQINRIKVKIVFSKNGDSREVNGSNPHIS